MPTYRSISICLISQFDILIIPEFPLPNNRTSQTSDTAVDGSRSDQDNDNSVVSVYVPTFPRAQFWISYSIAPPYPPKGLFYFKLFLNGAHVVSWGVSEEENYVGKTIFGLFSTTDGPVGYGDLEKRAFCFGSQEAEEDVTQDVLEIRVFRSNGRKRQKPVVQDVLPVMNAVYKEQGNEDLSEDRHNRPGICLANAGNVEDDHPQRFYQYALIDPLDQPFATFRYYPRSWEQLQNLGVASFRNSYEVSPSIETTRSDASADGPLYELETEPRIRNSFESTGSLWAPGDGALQANPVELPLKSPTPYSIPAICAPPTTTTPSPWRDSKDPSLSNRYASAFDRQRWTPSPQNHDAISGTVSCPAPTDHRVVARPTADSLRQLVSTALKRRSGDTSSST